MENPSADLRATTRKYVVDDTIKVEMMVRMNKLQTHAFCVHGGE
jgi:hypothetical protein